MLRCGRRSDARRRWQAARHVQLRVAGEASAGGSPAAGGSGDGGRDLEGDVVAICPAVRGRGAALDRPGTVAASLATADLLFRAERAPVGGATELQPAVPLVCGSEHG